MLVLAAATVALGLWYGTGLRWFPLWAIARAALQLSIVALLLRGVLAVPWTAAAFVLLMLSTASITAMGRTHDLWRGRQAAVVGVTAGALVSLGADLRAAARRPRGALRRGDGRDHHRQRDERRHPVRAQLPPLGAVHGPARSRPGCPRRHPVGGPPRDRPRGRAGVADPHPRPVQSTGLVTLPGAFVGALFGGASPADAAKFQLVVLAGIALAMTVTAIVVTTIAGRCRTSWTRTPDAALSGRSRPRAGRCRPRRGSCRAAPR